MYPMTCLQLSVVSTAITHDQQMHSMTIGAATEVTKPTMMLCSGTFHSGGGTEMQSGCIISISYFFL